MIKLLIPCAGKSSRFPGKPKWLLTCPNGNLMIQESITGLDLTEIDCIYITFLREHIEKYCKNCDLNELFRFTKKEINIYILTSAIICYIYRGTKNKRTNLVIVSLEFLVLGSSQLI